MQEISAWFAVRMKKRPMKRAKVWDLEVIAAHPTLTAVGRHLWRSLVLFLDQSVRTRNQIVHYLPFRWHCMLIWRLVRMCRSCEYM
jgi:hypothetical protein